MQTEFTRVMTSDQFHDLLDAQTYPIDASDLIDRHGDHEFTHPTGSESLAAVIERSGEETFESAFDAQQAVYASLSAAAIGREGYSDRDPTPMGVDGHEPVSF